MSDWGDRTPTPSLLHARTYSEATEDGGVEIDERSRLVREEDGDGESSKVARSRRSSFVEGDGEEAVDEEETARQDGETEEELDEPRGVSEVEAAAKVWTPRNQWFLFLGIALSAYIYSLDGVTTWQYLSYATSDVGKHALSGTIATVQAIIIAVGKPLMAKLADVLGRAETFVIVAILYVVGYLTIATSTTIQQIAAGEVFYAFGYTGLQMLQQIVIADMTNLRWRGLVTGLISAPFIVNNFVAAEIAEGILPDWRWGYGMFAILMPVFLAPIIIALLWAQHQVRRHLRRHGRRSQPKSWSLAVYEACAEMDFVGLILVALCMGLILLPLGLAAETPQGFRSPTLRALVLVGLLLLPVFLLYEARFPHRPVLPMRWFRRGPILGACLIGFFDFVSFYLQYTYLYSYVYVTQHWNYRELTYFNSAQSLAMAVFGIIGGYIMYATRRFKYLLFLGLMIRLLGVILMIRARSPKGSIPLLIICQIIQGMGGGLAAITSHVSAQAAVQHADVATVISLVLLLSEVGNSVGSAVASGIWTGYMPGELRRQVPGGERNETLVNELLGSMEKIVEWPRGSGVREGAIRAYQAVMYKLVIGSISIALLPPIFCLVFTKDIQLSKAQNAVDGRDTSGKVVRLREGGTRDDDEEDGWDDAPGRGPPSPLARGGIA